MTTIFCFGGCDLFHALHVMPRTTDFKLAKDFGGDLPVLDFEKTMWPDYASTSLFSLYSPPGNMAYRVYDSLQKEKRLTPNQNHIYQEVCKWPWLKFFAKYAGPEDILLLNFTSELYTKYQNSRECFTLTPYIDHLKTDVNNKIHWLYNEVSNTNFQKAFDEDDILGPTIELVKDFAKDLEPIFGNRIILVDTILTELVCINDSIQKSVLNVHSIPFYKRTKLMVDPTDVRHVRRLLNLAYRGFQRSYKHTIPFVTMDPSEVYMDKDLNPMHLSDTSKNKLSLKILDEIIKMKTSICTVKS